MTSSEQKITLTANVETVDMHGTPNYRATVAGKESVWHDESTWRYFLKSNPNDLAAKAVIQHIDS